MSHAASASARLRSVDWKIAAGLALAATIAWYAPFDLGFGAATFGAPALRAAAMIALAVMGLAMGRRIGLDIEPRGKDHPILFPLGVAALVGVGCALSDWAFRPLLHGGYVDYLRTEPLGVRLAVFMLRAFNENILYRLFLGSALVWLIGAFWKDTGGAPAIGAYWLGFALSQAANIWINVTSQGPVTALVLVHDAIRYFTPGMIWAWLYWRRGFQSTEIASTSVHLFFQPLVTLVL